MGATKQSGHFSSSGSNPYLHPIWGPPTPESIPSGEGTGGVHSSESVAHRSSRSGVYYTRITSPVAGIQGAITEAMQATIGPNAAILCTEISV